MNDTPSNSRPPAIRTAIAILLSVTLGLFLGEAGVSLLDDTLILIFGLHALGAIQGMIFVLLLLVLLLVYALSGITPLIPKRFFLPLVLCIPLVQLAVIPFLIFHFDQVQALAWFISLGQFLLGLGILFWVQGTFRCRWPVVRPGQLGDQIFSWPNLTGFVLVNVFVLLPGVLVYLGVCVSLAVDHFSGGFLALRSDGLAIRAKTYVRDDHKTVKLIPMMHIGETAFYDQITESISTNSVILLEGVTDNEKLLTPQLSYTRAAQSLGLVEQREEFAPPQARSRRADVDVARFSERTIAFLNLTMRIHAEGWRAENFRRLIQESQGPVFLEELVDDLLTKRNANLLKEIEAQLPGSEVIVVPWGAAHMRGVAEGIEKTGFHVADTQEFMIFHFRSVWNRLFQLNQSKQPPRPAKHATFARPNRGSSAAADLRTAEAAETTRVIHSLGIAEVEPVGLPPDSRFCCCRFLAIEDWKWAICAESWPAADVFSR